MTIGNRIGQTLMVAALGALVSGGALAQTVVTRLVVAGGSATSVKVIPGATTSMDVRLDIVNAPLFGTGFRLTQTAPGTSGVISITGRSFVGSPFTDTTSGIPDSTVLFAPSNLLDPDNDDNLGRTTVGLVSIAPTTQNNVLAANLTFTIDAAAALGTYTILPTAIVSSATDTNFVDYDMTTGTTPFTIIVGRTLTVTKSGLGTGTVAADSGAISCGATCSDIYPGTVVTLTATPTGGAVFTGWTGGGCSGTGTCVVTVDAAKTVNAAFDIAPVALDVSKNGTGTGTVTSSPAGINCGATCTANFSTGSSVTLTPTADAGSVFAGWAGACTGSGACIVSMTAAKSVTATFNIQQFRLTVSKAGTGTGTVTSDVGGINCGATCFADYNSGTVVTLTASPTTGVFAGWSGGGCSGTGTCVVTMNAAKTVTATFAPTFSVTVNKAGTGTGTVTSSPGAINCGATCTDTFAQGTVVTLTAAPDAGMAFAGWSGGGCSGTGTCVVTVNSAVTVTATFNAQFVLTAAKNGTGTGTVTSNVGGINCGATCTSTPINSGTLVTLTAAPAGGSIFAGWSGGGCSGTGTCVVTLTAATTVTATFNAAFTLTVAKAGNGTGTVTSDVGGINCGATCAASYTSGTVVTLTATPGAGQNFTGWSGGGCSGTGTCAVTVTAATTVTATFTDTIAPTTVINQGPSNPSNQANPTFSFSADEANVTFQCKLDAGSFQGCVSPNTVTVTNGAHTFSVFATDAAGNVGPTVVYSWTAANVVNNAKPVPTLNEWMLMVLTLMLGALGMTAFRRRNG
ncbi:MAG: IPTL-CTERM sorting domain-containing protein [Betaproteobacteria bacterium]